MFAVVFVHPIKPDGSEGIRSCPAKSISEAISLVVGLTCSWSICFSTSQESFESEGWDYRIDSTRNTHGTRGVVTWQEHRELNIFLPNYDSPTVWADLREIEKKFRHNVRAWVQSQKKKIRFDITTQGVLSTDSTFALYV